MAEGRTHLPCSLLRFQLGNLGRHEKIAGAHEGGIVMADSPNLSEETTDHDEGECGVGGCSRPLVLEGSVLHRLRLLWGGT
jgi:hypothetical protein